MAKRDRENRLRERRADKAARKEARKLAAQAPDATPGTAESEAFGPLPAEHESDEGAESETFGPPPAEHETNETVAPVAPVAET